jgi:hypothetical protein
MRCFGFHIGGLQLLQGSHYYHQLGDGGPRVGVYFAYTDREAWEDLVGHTGTQFGVSGIQIFID